MKWGLIHKGCCGKPSLFYEGPIKPERHWTQLAVLPGCTWPDGTKIKKNSPAICPECKQAFLMDANNFEVDVQ